MKRGAAASNLTASPVLVGAVTLLVTLVAVYLSYNANSGLPFVPTYDLKADVPNAANLVRGNDVRIGGARVGTVSKITPVPSASGKPSAQLELKLDRSIQPLPVDTKFIVRPRSALGLKYVELTPGRAKAGFTAGSTIPIEAAQPEPVEIDDVFNMFDARARRGAQRSLNGFGTGLAGRGDDLNTAIQAFKPLLDDLEPVARNLSSPRTRLDRLFPALEATASEVAPVAETQAALFGNLNTTFTALAGVARPFLQDFITESPPTLETGTVEFPRQRPFLRNSAAFFSELRPGVATLPASAPVLADALEAGIRTLPKTPPLNRNLARVFDSARAVLRGPAGAAGHQATARHGRVPEPDGRVHHARADAVQLREPAPAQPGQPELRGRLQGHLRALHHRRLAAGQEQHRQPVQRAGQRAGAGQLPAREPVPQHRIPGPGQGVRGRQEPWLQGRRVLGNVPGNQGLISEGKPKPKASGATQ